MLLNLEPYPPSTGTPITVDVDQDSTIEDLILLFLHHANDERAEESRVVLNVNGKLLPKEKTLMQLRIPNGHTLRIGFEDDVLKSKKSWLKMAIFGGIVIVIVLISLALSLYFLFRDESKLEAKKKLILEESNLFRRSKNLWCDHPQTSPRKYGIVVDNGESNTCAAFYSWIKYRGSAACLTEENECCIRNNKGGLASRNPENHMRRITVCVKNVTSRMEDTQHISVYVAATMKIHIANGRRTTNVSSLMLNRVRDYLIRAGFTNTHGRVLSGEEEALYGWIAVAYLREAFKGGDPTAYGYIDLGERTAKISFSTNRGTTIRLYGVEYNIFSKSYLCFGKDSAKQRYQSLLIKNVEETEVEDPCLPHNETETKSGFEMFWGMCTNSSRLQKHQDIVNRKYTFRGSGDPFHCRRNISQILSEEECRRYAFFECFHKIVVPQHIKFLAHSSFFSFMKFINLQSISLQQFSEIANDCYHGHENKTRTEEVELCFGLQYVYELLVTGYGFTDTTWDSMKFVGDQVNTEDISWTLGYMLYESSD